MASCLGPTQYGIYTSQGWRARRGGNDGNESNQGKEARRARTHLLYLHQSSPIFINLHHFVLVPYSVSEPVQLHLPAPCTRWSRAWQLSEPPQHGLPSHTARRACERLQPQNLMTILWNLPYFLLWQLSHCYHCFLFARVPSRLWGKGSCHVLPMSSVLPGQACCSVPGNASALLQRQAAPSACPAVPNGHRRHAGGPPKNWRAGIQKGLHMDCMLDHFCLECEMSDFCCTYAPAWSPAFTSSEDCNIW